MYGRYPFLFPSSFVLGMTGLSSLHCRRSFFLIKFLIKIINGSFSLPEILSQLNLFVPDHYSRHCSLPLFLSPPSRTDLMKYSLLGIGVKLLNNSPVLPDLDVFSLPRGVVNLKSILPMRKDYFSI